jgi:Tol biopolymer transport system component/tRNA A-37 threonylcarbamoyl transferase component Bud32
MAITPGTRIGAYEVTSQLGEGGMGVVYRARDTKLLRDAALKVLPEHFADDPNRLSMLQREAQLLASLNHPNIAQIYGLEQVGSTGCIVMELVEGETLSDKLKNGPLPFDEALEIAKQIADALAAAHERGIVHRDLKPANIKLTPNGTVKVLDFGLAKVLNSPSEKKTDLSMMPTKVSGSITGSIVGTVGYMSPEQARGKEVDARTDIWSFGCVLFEMLTARLAFEAETATDMIAKIVTAEPDLNLLPPNTPPSIRLLLSATLNKNVHQRLQHIGDMRLFLDPKMFIGGAGATATVLQDKPKSSPVLLSALAVAVATAVVLGVLYFRTPALPPASEMRFELAIPEMTNGSVSASPDGQRFTYATVTDGTRALWIRSIASETAQRLTGTDNVIAGAWAPDSQRIAFIADGKLRKVDINSGAVQGICDVPGGQTRGLSWNRDGVILIARPDNVIARVSDSTGEIKPLTTLDQSKKETVHALPTFLPDGNHFIYAIVSTVPDNAGIFVGSLDGQMKKRLLPLGPRLEGIAYAPQGYLILSTGAVTVQRFDAKNFTLSGQPVSFSDGALLSVSDNGLMLYRKPAAAPAARQLTWFDRNGKQTGQLGASGNYGDVQISPNGDRVALDITDPTMPRDVWVMDVARAVLSRVTLEMSDDWNPAWSPDGNRLVFASAGGGTGTHIHTKSYTGAGKEDLVFESNDNEIPTDWSPNGRYIPFSRQKKGGGVDLWVLDTMEKKTSPFIESRFDKAQSKISPDGRFLAYTTNDSGTYQIVVQSFPDPTAGKWQITSEGGIEPKWRHDGRELYYLAFDGKLMAVSIKGEKTLEAGTAMPLFDTPLTYQRGQLPRTHRYDVAPDGRFLLAVPKTTAASPPIVAVMNWTASLEKKHE